MSNNVNSCIGTTAFAIPDPYTFVNLPILKSFAIGANANFQLRGEASNLFNHPSAGIRIPRLTRVCPGNPAKDAANPFRYGDHHVNVYSPRYLQLSGKFIF